MRVPHLLLALFLCMQFHAQNSHRTLELHDNFKKHVFKNTDSSQYYIQLLKKEIGQSKNSLPAYYFNQNLGQFHFIRGQMDSSEYHYKKAYDISTMANWDSLQIDSKIWLANHQYFKGNTKRHIDMYKEILLQSQKVDYLEGITNAYGMFAGREVDLSKKMGLYLKIDSLYQVNNKESPLLAQVYGGIANLYVESQGNYNLARSYLKKASEISDRVNYPPGKYVVTGVLMRIARLEENYDNVIQLNKELLQHGLTHDYPTAENVGIMGISQAYLKKGDLQNAEKYLNKGKYLLKLPSGAPLLGRTHLLWAEFYLLKDNHELSFYHLKKARDNPDLTDGEHYFMEVMEVEIMYFEAIENFEKAYSIKKNLDSKKSIISEQQNSNLFILNEQLRLKTESEQKLALIKSQSELASQKQKNHRNLLLGGFILTSFAGLFLFILYRNRQRTYEKLRDIDTLKTNFFTNISHEFRTPLTLISAPIQESLEEPNLSEEKRKHFELAQKNTNRLSSLVDQLLELSKIDSGNRSLLLEKNYPTQMISAWSESFVYLSKQKDIDFKTKITDKKIEAWFDRDALEKIIVNLLGNAIKYTPNNGTIHLFAGIKNNYLNIKVKNSGEGLTKAQMKNLFNRFYQTDYQSEGYGIGLSLIKELAELHGGDVKVSSEMGVRTIFEATLGLDRRKLKNAAIKQSPDSLPENKSIVSVTKPITKETIDTNEQPIALLVEDNPDLGILLTDTFKKEYKVVLAANGQEGIAKALELIPDIIVSDVMMPVKDGIELVKTLKEDEKTSHIPIVLLTAKAGDGNELIGIETGADDYITKPFNKRILKAKVASLIASRQKLRSRYSQEVILKPKDIAITSADERFLGKVQEVLDEKLIESSFTIEEFSRAVNMSRMQLHRKLKALTGLSASEFIRSQRLKLAAQLLKQSDSNVSQVGYSVGFNDHAYFSKCFKEVFKATPSEFALRK